MCYNNTIDFVGVKNMSINEEREIERLKQENLRIKQENLRLMQKLIRLQKEEEELYEFAYKDTLTSLYNRRGMQQAASSLDPNNSHAVVMCDIDAFKSINDNYGHDVGDMAIKTIGDLIDATRREDDFAARLGGDEFIIVFKNCPLTIAEAKCITLSRIIEKQEKNLFGFHITLSFGIAEYNSEIGFEEALKDADKALYESKNRGKNRTTIYDSKGDNKKKLGR